jgi:hypothetical protein
MIKPEFWTDDRVCECSTSARLLLIATWCFADDQGSLDRSAKQLKAQAFPHDSVDVEPLLNELLRVGILIEYESGGKRYLHIKNFLKHQRIDRPSAPRCPLYDDSTSIPVPLDEDSTSTRPKEKGIESEEKGIRKRKLLKEKENKVPREAFNALTVPGLDVAVWIEWIAYRSEIKKPIRPASLALAAKRLAAMGPGQRAAVEYSIASGYQGLFAPKPNGKHAPPVPNHSAEWAEAKHLAASIGFRPPWPQESVGAYTTSIKMEMNKSPARSIAQLASDVRKRMEGQQP